MALATGFILESEMDDAERLMRKVVDACTDCDCCRYLMDTNCLLFPEMYRLWDREMETGNRITHRELRHLADLCNYCGLCPCPNIREDIITAKTLFIDREGLDPYIRALEDVERLGKLCGALPRLTNFVLQNKYTAGIIKRSAGIDPRRKLPIFPKESFSSWARQGGLHEKASEDGTRKVAYFAGCTARYLFPAVPRAAVEVLQHNGITVYYPEQICCGMPCMLEGDRKLTRRFAERTVSYLAEVISDGYDVVCSCPTCGYMLKVALSEGAYYATTYQDLVGGDGRYMKIPEHITSRKANRSSLGMPAENKATSDGHPMNRKAAKMPAAGGGSVKAMPLLLLDKAIYGKILKDNGFFSGIDPLKRIAVAENTYDLGQYLQGLHASSQLDLGLGPVRGQAVYYPPCHLREQGVGMPYLDLMGLIPDMSMQAIESTDACCGMAGIMGFKCGFHSRSIRLGSRLMAKIKRLEPDRLLTDCLSCRLQFNQMSDIPVTHPIEVLRTSYENAMSGGG